MTEVFIIRNQDGHFWGKSKVWVDGRDARAVFRAKHHDQALNTLFEVGSKDVALRGDVVASELSSRGEPTVEVSQVALPPPEESQPSDTERAADADPAALDNTEEQLAPQ